MKSFARVLKRGCTSVWLISGGDASLMEISPRARRRRTSASRPRWEERSEALGDDFHLRASTSLPRDEHGVVVSASRRGFLLFSLLLVLFDDDRLLPRFRAWIVASALDCVCCVWVPLYTLEADVRATGRGGLPVGIDAASPHHSCADKLRPGG
jgi:hypothetical protein